MVRRAALHATGRALAPGRCEVHHRGGRLQGGLPVCHESWFHRRDEDREASRRMWEEFERTRPVSDSGLTEEEREVILEGPETPRLATKD